jgi:adenylate cyclase
MPGVFVSYCRPSAQVAEQVAAALSAIGYDVWRDDQLPAHRAYGDVIEEQLRSAAAVVVLWSSDARQSQWVRAEADHARQAGTLVQASLDGTIPPLPFNQIQCADLSAWEGDTQFPGWQTIEHSIAALAPIDRSNQQSGLRSDRPSICVLPFQNMSGDAEQEYFSDGISEDITTDLSRISALAVTARNTAFTFKGKAVDVCKVARAVHVSHVLEGSVRKAGERLRITAQLIDGVTGEHLWAERYDRDLTDVFAIQDEISHAIVEALQVKLLPAERKAIEQRGTTSAEAYDLYLMARNCWIAGDFSDARRVGRVIRICQQAIEADPDYAQAWALIALGQAHVFHGIGPNAGSDDGAAAAERALALDPNIAEARLPMAWRLVVQGKFDEANAELAEAMRLNPDSWEVNKEAARLFYRQRRIDEAVPHLERATKIVDADFHGWGMLFACYLAQGDKVRVEECAKKIVGLVEGVVERDPDNGIALAIGANSFAALGQLDKAWQWASRAERLDSGNLFMRYNLAFGLAGVFEDEDAAIDMIAPVLAKGGPSTIRLASVDPNFDGLRDDGRFREMLGGAYQRLGIEPITAIPAATSAPRRS